MSLFKTISGWIDTGVDWVADAFGDSVEVDDLADSEFAFEGASDVISSSSSSEVLGFIKEGAGAFLKAQGTGKDQMPLIQQTKFVKTSTPNFKGSRSMTMRSPMTPTPVRIGYNNPDVRSALTALAQSSYNQQMNNMFSQYLVKPTKGIGTKTIGLGTTQVKGISRKSRQTTARS